MERGEDEHAGTLRAALADHGKASSVDIQRWNVHSQYLLVIDDRPRLDLEQETASGEQLLDPRRGYAPPGEVAGVIVRVARHRRNHVIEEQVEFRRVPVSARASRRRWGRRPARMRVGGRSTFLEGPFDGPVSASELMRYLADAHAEGVQFARLLVPGAAGFRRRKTAPPVSARLVSVDLRLFCPIVVPRQ